MKTLRTATAVTDRDRQMLLSLKAVILAHDPEAEVILYGSTARGARQPDSDYDVLVITSRELSSSEARRLDGAVYSVELEMGIVLSLMLYSREQWFDPRMKGSPYRTNVIGEGITL